MSLRISIVVWSLLTVFSGGRADAVPITVAPGALNFPDTGVAGMSMQQTVTITNASNAVVSLQNIVLAGVGIGDYIVTPAIPLPVNLGVGAPLPVTVVFSPIALGARPATLTANIANNGGSVTINLTGKGLGPQIGVNPSPVNAGGTKVNVPTMVPVIVSNAGGGRVIVSSVKLAGGDVAFFTLGGLPNFPATLNAGQAINATLTFLPTAARSYSTSLLIVSDDPNTPNLLAGVKGAAGDPTISTDVGGVAFGNVRLGLSSMPQVVNVSNIGASDMHISAIATGGAMPGDYSFTSAALPILVPSGQSTAVNVTFKPSAMGTSKATLVISSDDSMTPNKSLVLLGAGTQSVVALGTKQLDFGKAKLYQSTDPQSVIINNTGSDTANVTALSFGGMQAAWFKAANVVLPLKIPAAGMVSIDVRCAPLVLGAGAGVLNITTDDPNTPMLTVPVTATGVGSLLSITPPFADFGTMGTGASRTITVKLTNTGTDTLNIETFGINDPMASFNIPNPLNGFPISLDPNKSTSFDVQFNPMMEGSYMANVEITTDTPKSKLVRIPIDGNAAMSKVDNAPNGLTFASTLVNAVSAPQIWTITNSGAAPVTISSVTLAGANPGDFRLDDPMTPVVLQNKDKLAVSVSYLPVNAGAHMATLTANVTGLMPITCALSGNGVVPMIKIAVGDEKIDFLTIPIGMSSDALPVRILNGSPFTVNINPPVASDSNTFIIDSAMTKLSLSPGGMTQFLVSFVAKAPQGEKQATIMLTTPDSPTPLGTVALQGYAFQSATPPPMRVSGCAIGASSTGENGSLALLLLLPLAGLLVRRRRHNRA